MHTVTMVGVAGVTAGMAGGAKGLHMMKPVIERANEVRRADLQMLATGQSLPPIPPPEDPPARRPRHIVLCYTAGMVIGVVAGALIGIMIVQLIATAAPGDVPATERVLGGLFGGFIGGVIGAIPGIVLGAVIWLLEVRARLRAATSFLQRSLWEQREARRGELEAGRVSPDEAAQQIRGELEEAWW